MIPCVYITLESVCLHPLCCHFVVYFCPSFRILSNEILILLFLSPVQSLSPARVQYVIYDCMCTHFCDYLSPAMMKYVLHL
jgi:hypothetical protein